MVFLSDASICSDESCAALIFSRSAAELSSLSVKPALEELFRLWNAAETFSFGVPALVPEPLSPSAESELDPQPLIPTAAARPKPANAMTLERVVTTPPLL